MRGRVPLWLDLIGIPEEKRRPLLEAARRANVDRIIDESTDGLQRITIRSIEDQDEAAQTPGTVIVDSKNWNVIPIENLIAARRDRPGTLFAVAKSSSEARLMRNVLEVGVHGVVLHTTDPDQIRATATALRREGPRQPDEPAPRKPVALVPAMVTAIDDVGMAERVCVDCTSRFAVGAGLLVGSKATSLALIHAETIDTEFAPARPFRVNAGALHCYVLGPDNRTRYLSELAAGSQVLGVASDGATQALTVGRAKIEARPHAMVQWRDDDGHESSVVVQWAETIRFVRPNGEPVEVTALEPGDSIMVYSMDSARHMGLPIEESLVER